MARHLLASLARARTQQLLWFTLLSAAAFGQAPTMPNTVPYENHGSYVINLQNLTVGVNFPVRSKSGLTAFSASLSGTLNSLDSSGGFVKPSALPTSTGALSVNGLLGDAVRIWYTIRKDMHQVCNVDQEYVTLSGWYVKTADGAVHPFIANLDENMCYHSAFSNAITIDGSGLTVSYSLATDTGSITTANGDVVPAVGGSLGGGSLSVHDSNGNQISAVSGYTTYTDTLGQPVLKSSGGNDVSWLDSSGTTYQHVTFLTTSKVQSTSWGCASPYTDKTYAASPFLTNVAYPDGTNVGITYETSSGGITGRIASLKLRTGGMVSFTYSGINCGTNGQPTTTSVMYQTINGKQWKYTYTPTSTGNTTTVLDPAGNQTVYTFVPAALNYGSVLTQTQRFQGTSTLLSSTLYCYNNNTTNCLTTGGNYPVTALDAYTTLGAMTTSSRTKQTFDAYGNVLTSAVYGFGDTTPKFTTTTTYGGCGTSINDKPCDVLTSDGTNTVSESKATYDALGNRLTSSSWTGTTWLGSSATYNGNGTLATSTAIDGTAATYTYGNCNGAFPTQVSVGSISTYASWDCSGGVKVSSTDANGDITTYGYKNAAGTPDPFWRVSSVTDSALPGTAASITYTGTTTEKTLTFGTSTQDTISTVDAYGRPIRKQTKHGTLYDTITTTYNETANTVSTSVPCTVALGADCTTGFTTATLDAAGRNSSTVDGGGATVTTTYPKQDVLTVLSPAPGTEKTKQLQKEYDGLGRVLSSCTILTAGGSSCGQVTAGSGTPTTFGYASAAGSSTTTARRGVQTRTTVKDALGRTTSQTDPESGTTTYTYDSVPSPGICGGHTSEPGKLMLITKTNGASICYFYGDPAGRVTDTTGWGVGATVCQRFRYDNSAGVTGVIPSGITPSNPVGHMVEAETDTCGAYPPTAATILTDEWFGYDAKGNRTDVWQSTPHSGGYYHSTATYFPNGQLASATIPGLGTVTYTLDGDGKPYSAVQGSLNLVSGVTYGPVGPTTINIGSGSDHDLYGYDAAGRMHTFQFFVGAKNALGTLNWNANGTLGSLNVVDGFSAMNTQTCTFIYDDIARLTSDQCGGPWAQTFAYDQYDNLNQYGSGYNTLHYDPNTNRYTDGGTSYDASGNLASDGTNNFAYDAFNKLSSAIPVGKTCTNSTLSTCITSDAFGQPVELQNSVGYYQMIYGPLGKTTFMFGQTLQYAYIPTPGGGTAIGWPTGMRYTHMDWLGTGRVSSYIPASGNGTIYYDRSFAPYGQMYGNNGPAGLYGQTFAGDTGDLYWGLFDTPNREYAQGQGRWLTPDPAHSGWNRYAYPTDPNTATDPSGLIQQVIQFQTHFTGFDLNFMWEGSTSESSGGPPSYTVPADCGGIGCGTNAAPAPVGTVSTVQIDEFGNVVPGSEGWTDTNGNSGEPSWAAQFGTWAGQLQRRINDFLDYLACGNHCGMVNGGTPSDGINSIMRVAALRVIHTTPTLQQSASYQEWNQKSTQEIIDSLAPGNPNMELTVYPDGGIANGNTRISILLERGVDVNSLPYVLRTPPPLEPLELPEIP